MVGQPGDACMLSVSTQSDVDQLGVDGVDLGRGQSKSFHYTWPVTFQEDIHFGKQLLELVQIVRIFQIQSNSLRVSKLEELGIEF